LGAGPGAQLVVERDQLQVDGIDHAQRDRQLLTGGGRKLIEASHGRFLR